MNSKEENSNDFRPNCVQVSAERISAEKSWEDSHVAAVVHCSFFSITEKYFLKLSMPIEIYEIGFTVNHLYNKKL